MKNRAANGLMPDPHVIWYYRTTIPAGSGCCAHVHQQCVAAHHRNLRMIAHRIGRLSRCACACACGSTARC
jgi:hypothetical protein